MQTIWDLPASLWPTQPFIPPPDPTQPPPWPRPAPPILNPSAPQQSSFGWAVTPSAQADVPPDPAASVLPRDSAVRQALAAQAGSSRDSDMRDMAYYDRMLADAKQAYDFAMWAFGPPSTPQANARSSQQSSPDRLVSSELAPYVADSLTSSPPQSRASEAIQSVTRRLLSGLASAASASGQAAQAEMTQPIDVPSASEASELLNKTPVEDFFNSTPRGVLKGLANTASAGGQAAQIEMGQQVDVPSADEATDIVERNVTGALPRPHGIGGQAGETVGEFLSNPTSYLGPGGVGAKVFGAIASALGSETAGQLVKGTWLEPFARIGGAILTGGAAGSAINRERAAGRAGPKVLSDETGPHGGGPRPSLSADGLKFVEDAPPTVPDQAVSSVVGPDDLANLRVRMRVPWRHTVGVASTTVPGLEDRIFEGGSSGVYDEARLPRPARGQFKSLFEHTRSWGHAEEDLANQFHREVQALGLLPRDLAGHELRMYLSRPSCPSCVSGLDTDATPGVLKQLSTLYPDLIIHVGADTPKGARYFTIRNGSYISRGDR